MGNSRIGGYSRSVAMAAAVATMVVVIGCGGKRPPAEAESLPSEPLVPATRPATPTSLPATKPADAAALAEQTNDYARRIAELLEKRRQAATQPAHPKPVAVTQPTEPAATTAPAATVPASQPAEMASTQPTTKPATKPAISAAPRPVPTTQSLGAKLRQQAQASPRDLRSVFDEQLYQLLEGNAVPQKQAMAALSAEDRRIAEALLSGLAAAREQIKQGENQMQGAKVQPLLDMADQIRTLAPLRVPTVAICTRVDGYGIYEPIEPARVRSHRDTAVVLYSEVAGFTSRQGDRRIWETRLTQEVCLYNEQGMVVWRDRSNTIVDNSRNCRRDFFIARVIRIPGTLPEGKYILKVSVMDTLGSKVAEGSLPIQVAALPEG